MWRILLKLVNFCSALLVASEAAGDGRAAAAAPTVDSFVAACTCHCYCTTILFAGAQFIKVNVVPASFIGAKSFNYDNLLSF